MVLNFVCSVFRFKWLFFLFFLVSSCTTVKKIVIKHKLDKAQDEKSSQVSFSPPLSPFQPQESKHLDALWWNEETQNSISYFSSCPKGGLPASLQEIETGVLSEVADYNIIKTVEKKNTRHTKIRAFTNKGEVWNSIYIIKEINCFYILNFVASSQENFKKDERLFNRFRASFQGL